MTETIVTFDGKEWDKEEITKRAEDDSFYYDYLGKNTLSSSSVKKLLESPASYMKSISTKQEDIDAFKFGRLIHELILEPDVDYNWNVIDAKDKRSKEWKDAVKEDIPNTILKRDYDKCKRTGKAFNSNKEMAKCIEGMDTEIPVIGYIEGVPFRAKADAIDELRIAIVDLKTTGDINKFNKWTCMSYGYDCQVYIYCELFGVHYSMFEFVVIDKLTNTSGWYSVSKEFYESGKEKTLRAIALYKKHAENGFKDANQHVVKGML